MTTRTLALAAALVAAVSANLALAQDAPRRGAPPAMQGPGAQSPDMRPDGPRQHMRQMMRQQMRGQRPGFMRERGEPGKYIEGRIAFLKTELKIDAKQAQAWDQYAAFMREAVKTRAAETAKRQADVRARPDPGAQPARPPLLERLTQREARLQTALQLSQKRKAATEILFKVLSDEQKKIAEDLL